MLYKNGENKSGKYDGNPPPVPAEKDEKPATNSGSSNDHAFGSKLEK